MKPVMHFYVTRAPDGTLHVQNALMGMLGQHHVHTQAGFDTWRVGISEDALHYSDGECACGLSAGYVRDHNGKVWRNEKFAV